MEEIEIKDKYINTLPINEADKLSVVQSIWNKDNIIFQIIDYSHEEPKQWKGTVSICDLQSSADDLEILRDEFIKEIRMALCTNGGHTQFIYSIKDGKFFWHKKDKFKVEYGFAKLEPVNDLHMELLHNASNLIECMRNSYQTLVTKNQEMEKQYEVLKNSYENLVSHKKRDDEELFTKFYALLKTKKQMIKNLNDLIERNNIERSDNLIERTSSEDEYDTESQTTITKNLPPMQKLCDANFTNEPSTSTNWHREHSSDGEIDDELFEKM